MIKLKSILLESFVHSMPDITIDTIVKLYDKYSRRNSLNSGARQLGILEDFYYDGNSEHKKIVEDYLTFLNKIKNHIVSICDKLQLPYVQPDYIYEYLLVRDGEFTYKEEDFFPFPLYVSVNKDPMDTIGILVDKDGKVLEIHEGNDEASAETINFVNKLVNPKGKMVRIYASHNIRLVQNIDINGYLPVNLYVSSDRGHASSHLDLKGERVTFTGIINLNDVSQESDLDWKTIRPTKIDKFRYL